VHRPMPYAFNVRDFLHISGSIARLNGPKDLGSIFVNSMH